MVDAAVGGKTGINTAEGKNLVGAFHPPAGVLCDLDALATLPQADLVAGLAEVVKCGFIADPRILELVEADPERRDPARPAPHVRELVERAVAVKAEVVAAGPARGVAARDPQLRPHVRPRGRAGRALPAGATARPSRVGMVYVAELARLAGRTSAPRSSPGTARCSTSLGLPTTYARRAGTDLLAAMRRDKKSRGALLRFVVLEDSAGRSGSRARTTRGCAVRSRPPPGLTRARAGSTGLRRTGSAQRTHRERTGRGRIVEGMSTQTPPRPTGPEPSVHPDHDRGLEFDVRTLMARRSGSGCCRAPG